MLRRYKDELLIILFGSIFFIPFLGSVHLFDWDEINFAEAAREMIVSGNYLHVQINFQPFWEKPPLFFWMQVLSMKIFGINEFAARFPNAICGIISLLVVFRTGLKLKDRKLGWLWVMAFGCSFLPMGYFKSGIIDPWFNLFIFSSLLFFIKYTNDKSLINIFLSGLFTGLAVLTKGPASVIVLALVILFFYLLTRFRNFISIGHILFFIGSVILVLLPWLSVEIIQNGTWFIWEFTKYQLQLASSDVAGHKGFPGYHFVVVFFFCLPASIFAIASFKRDHNNDEQVNYFRKWMLILFWVVILLFSVVQTKIPHYSSLTYLPLSFLAALAIYNLKEKWKTRFTIGLLFSFLPLILLTAIIPVIAQNPELVKKYFESSSVLTSETTVFRSYEIIFSIALILLLATTGYLNFKKKSDSAALILFIGSAIIFNCMLIDLAPKVEYYSQRPMIDFLSNHKNDNAYLTVTGLKSYAHLFYGEIQSSDLINEEFTAWIDRRRKSLDKPASWPAPDEFQLQYNLWLLHGKINKPAYFIIRSSAITNMMKQYPELTLVENVRSYAVLKRPAQTN